jgi:protein SCO1/2
VQPPGIYILTGAGKISRYLYGTEFHAKDLKFALIEASQRKIGSLRDRMLFEIFHYDSIRNSFTVDLWRIVAIVLIIQALIFGIFFLIFWKKKKA